MPSQHAPSSELGREVGKQGAGEIPHSGRMATQLYNSGELPSLIHKMASTCEGA